MHTTEMSAAIRPYSMALGPDSSLRKREKRVCIEKILFVVSYYFRWHLRKDTVESVTIVKSAM
jgi:hypothetical protein